MIEAEKQMTAIDRKEKIRSRYKGIDPSELEVIPAKPVDEVSLSERPLKVAAYLRVSTENDEQTSSYELQINDFTERIKANPNWEFVGIYSDEGISGTELSHRKGMLQMIEDDGYKYVRGELFANLREPAITIRNGNITFNTACINGLEDVVYVNLMINEDMKRLVVKGCSENDKDALRWCVAKPDKRKSRKMTCPDFTKLLYDMMGWENCYRYKIIGYKIVVDGETLYVFDLTVHKIFQETKKIKGQDGTALAETGAKTVSKPDRKGFYPEDIANTFGIPVEEHKKMMETEVSLDGFISIGAITGRSAADQETDNSAAIKPKSKSKDEKSIQLEDKG